MTDAPDTPQADGTIREESTDVARVERVHPGRQALAEGLVELERNALRGRPGWSRAKACGDAALSPTTVGEWFRARSAPKDFGPLWTLVTVLLDWRDGAPKDPKSRAQRRAEEHLWLAAWKLATRPGGSPGVLKQPAAGDRADRGGPTGDGTDRVGHSPHDAGPRIPAAGDRGAADTRTTPRFTVSPREMLQVREYGWPQCLVFLIRTGDLEADRLEELLGARPGSSEEAQQEFCGRLRQALQDVMDAFPARAVASDATSRAAATHAMCHLARLAACIDASLEDPPMEDGQREAGMFALLFAEFDRVRPAAWLPWGSMAFGGADWVRKLGTLANPVLSRVVRQDLTAAAALRYDEWRRSIGEYARELFFRVPPAQPTAVSMDEGHAEGGGNAGGIALAALDQMLGGFREPAPYDSPVSESLAWTSARTLTQPLVAGVGDLAGPVIPDLAVGYVNPAFRTAVYASRSSPHADRWWDRQPLRDDLEAFLTWHFTSLDALTRPLLVHGHPGSGKSLLTRLLAARLPGADYLPVRVELRSVSAATSVRSQIEEAIAAQVGEILPWADVVRGAPDRLPVVLLDGLDELLQAGGENWRYLEQVVAFQESEFFNRRPVAALVTSRTVVADRVGIPLGCRMIRLEPFDEPRIARWLGIWNETNQEYLAEEGLRPLETAAVSQYGELACQPLLLLLLALYDSSGNGLARMRDHQVSSAELYERLIREFLIRQVRKGHRRDPGPAPVTTDAETEMRRLSVVALGMFNRGTQSVDAEAVEADGQALLDEWEERSDRDFGRFFFIHEAQAMVRGNARKTFEFLHATFGEYLVARSIWLALKETVEQGDDRKLYALLSFTPLVERARVAENLAELLGVTEQPLRGELPGLLDGLLRDALDGRPPSDKPNDKPDYEPAKKSGLTRLACYTANLVTIRTMLDAEVRVSTLLRTPTPTEAWRRLAGLWESQLDAVSWDMMSRAISTERTRAEVTSAEPESAAGTDVVLRRAGQPPHQQPQRDSAATPLTVDNGWGLVRRAEFGRGLDHEQLLLATGIALATFPQALAPEPASGHRATGVRALIDVLLAGTVPPVERPDPQGLLRRFVACVGLLDELQEDLLAVFLPAVVRGLDREARSLPMDQVPDLVLSLATQTARLPARYEEQFLLRRCLTRLRAQASEDIAWFGKLNSAGAELDETFRAPGPDDSAPAPGRGCDRTD
ncbi:NACHT domain-containing protein [Streptomyces sp. NPDC001732]